MTKLFKRLIDGVSASHEIELHLISMLKEVYGVVYTSKIQKIFEGNAFFYYFLIDFPDDLSWQDGILSQDLTNAFNKELEQDDTNISFGMMVVGTNISPLKQPTHSFIIPSEILTVHDRFERHYKIKHSERKLTWLWNYSTNELKTHYTSQKYTLLTSAYQMGVLMQYNEGDMFPYEELGFATGIPTELLVQILESLIKAKLLVKMMDRYVLNLSRSDPMSFKILTKLVNANRFQTQKNPSEHQASIEA